MSWRSIGARRPSRHQAIGQLVVHIAGVAGLALAVLACSVDERLDPVAQLDAGTVPDDAAGGEGTGGGAPDAAGGSGGQGGAPDTPEGALFQVAMKSRVAVLLDEVPPSIRDRVADAYLAQPASFWEQRARRQVQRTREHSYFDLDQLPLPPQSLWQIDLAPEGAARDDEDGHDVVMIQYQFSAVLLSDAASPLEHPAQLAEPGDSEVYSFQLPADPDLVSQRIADECVDQDGLPMPYPACTDVVLDRIGVVVTPMSFERLPWDGALAASVRVAEPTFADGADLEVLEAGLAAARVSYRYFAPDDCALAEQCVGAPGWRRLLQFTASVHNRGGKALHLGQVAGSDLQAHNVFAFSDCHRHFHFLQYGDYSLGTGVGDKRAFCLVSTSRYSNNEWTPLVTPYDLTCDHQGIAAGWGDDYGIGLDCQWIDITDVDIAGEPLQVPLTFRSNPDEFLCEGTPVTDDEGKLVFAPTELVAENGEPIDRPQCDFFEGWDDNNEKSHTVTLLPEGSHVSEACPIDLLGPRRDCGFVEQEEGLSCAPGSAIQLSCSVADGAYPQTLRVCEASAVLGTALACAYAGAHANVVVEASPTAVTFTCPEARDALEPGGGYGLFVAPVFADDPLQAVTCVSM